MRSFKRFTDERARFEAADYFITEAREPELMNFTQLRAYIEELRASGYNVLEHEVGMHRKVAFPFVTLVMTLIAPEMALRPNRKPCGPRSVSARSMSKREVTTLPVRP